MDNNIIRVVNDGNFHAEAKDSRPSNLRPTDKAAKVMAQGIFKWKKMVVITGHGKVMYAISRLILGVLRKMMAKMNG